MGMCAVPNDICTVIVLRGNGAQTGGGAFQEPAASHRGQRRLPAVSGGGEDGRRGVRR